MLFYGRAGLVRLHQKEQVHDDMQTMTDTTTIEQMLESADHLIEKHREQPGLFDRINRTPFLPEGSILYSAQCAFGDRKHWEVELLDTTRRYEEGSIVTAQDDNSLDAALEAASRKIIASRSRGA